MGYAAREAMRAPGFVGLMRAQSAKPEQTAPEGLPALRRQERDACGEVARGLNLALD